MKSFTVMCILNRYVLTIFSHVLKKYTYVLTNIQINVANMLKISVLHFIERALGVNFKS